MTITLAECYVVTFQWKSDTSKNDTDYEMNAVEKVF